MIWVLLVIFQVKHFVCDYPLQNRYMLRKFLPTWDFALPLAVHAGVHGFATMTICLFANPRYWWLGLVDFAIHFLMDRLKAGPKYMGKWKALAASEYVDAAFMADRPHNVVLPGAVFKSHEYDRIMEARQKLWHNTLFWYALGFDQMVHHLTHYAVIYVLCQV